MWTGSSIYSGLAAVPAAIRNTSHLSLIVRPSSLSGLATLVLIGCTGGNGPDREADPGPTGADGLVAPVAGYLPTSGEAESISVGERFACGLDREGKGFCWGRNEYGQLGIGKSLSFSGELQPIAGNHRFRAISAGWRHACAVTVGGVAYCWGENYDGQLGNRFAYSYVPVPVENQPAPFLSVSAGVVHTCAVAISGEGYCWGNGRDGQLGNGLAFSHRSPSMLAGQHTFRSISAGARHTCGVTVDGVALCWGHGSAGRLGTGFAQGRLTPTEVVGDLTFHSVSAGLAHTCGVATTGQAYCWGDGASGQLGDGQSRNRSVPVHVVGDDRYQSVSVGPRHTCALTATESVHCWGNGSDGEFGRWPTVPQHIPGPRGPGDQALTVGAGGHGHASSCGRWAEEFFCWGYLPFHRSDRALEPTRIGPVQAE
ncbi:MAG: hypothetical protein GEU90_05430 [Gemmatimonas sp.]|nr:hypothetical protein [Gemmatimonas sp.]